MITDLKNYIHNALDRIYLLSRNEDVTSNCRQVTLCQETEVQEEMHYLGAQDLVKILGE